MRRFLHKKEFCVFRLPRQWLTPPLDDLGDVKIVDATQEVIDFLFKQDPIRRKLFKRFLASGFRGVILYQGSVWASYAWMSTPDTPGPIHLPSFIQKLKVYWIFYCRTADEFQGRGLYKRSIITLCKWAREQELKGSVYIDSEISNIASIRAIQAAGFQSNGTILTWGFYIPKLKPIIWGKWLQTDNLKVQGVDNTD